MVRRKNQRLVSIYILVIVIFLFSVAAYFVAQNDENFRNTILVGDGICGNLPTESGQDVCCSKAHADDLTIQCVGRWQYVSGITECQYVCDGAFPSCPEDAKVCDDESTVVRSPKNNCEFNDCFDSSCDGLNEDECLSSSSCEAVYSEEECTSDDCMDNKVYVSCRLGP